MVRRGGGGVYEHDNHVTLIMMIQYKIMVQTTFFLLPGHCSRRNFHTGKNFVLYRWPTFVHEKFSYSDGGVRCTCIRVWFSYATKFRTFRQKYEIYEIKSRMKICAITVYLNRQQRFKPEIRTFLGAWRALIWGRPEFPGWNIVVCLNVSWKKKNGCLKYS